MGPISPRNFPSLVSFVIPLFNEEETVPHLRVALERAANLLECAVEWVVVNDGSSDATGELLSAWAENDRRVKVVQFARNFGHQAAITAGLDFASGDAVVFLDGDLQDPPELVAEMARKYALGYDVIFARRLKRHGETFIKRATAALFYALLRKLTKSNLEVNAGDFCMLSMGAARALRSMRERHRFLRGMVAWMGFSRTTVEFERPERAHGTTKFHFRKMLTFAWDAIFSFSVVPLRLAIIMGVSCSAGGGLLAIWGAVVHLRGGTVAGWTSLLVLGCVLGGMILVCLGIIGEYVGRIYEESKGRPMYIVRATRNIVTTRELPGAVYAYSNVAWDPAAQRDSTLPSQRQAS